MICIFQEKVLNKILCFVINVGYKDTQMSKDHTLAYLTPAQYESYYETGEAHSNIVIANILATILGHNVEILPAIPACSKMMFPGDHTPPRKVVLQDAKISEDTQEKVNSLWYIFEDIMSSSSSDICYTKQIEMEIETDQKLPPVASKPYTLPLKHQEWV